MPLIAVVVILIMVFWFNPCTQKKTENLVEPQHLNMNNFAWQPNHRRATVHTISGNVQGLSKITNAYRIDSPKHITGMFHQNVYGNMSRNSIHSFQSMRSFSLEGEASKNGLKERKYIY